MMAEHLSKQPGVDAVSASLKIADLHEERNEERLKEITSPQEWGRVVAEVVNKIVKNPDWLISEDVFSADQVELNIRLLLKVRQAEITLLEDIVPLSGDQRAVYAFVMRFLEQFSLDYNFPYVWRGGELKDTEENQIGSYTFEVSEAKNRVVSSYGKVREQPTLIRLKVQSIVDAFKQNSSHEPIQAEHDYDGIFSVSFELNLSIEHPEGITTFSI